MGIGRAGDETSGARNDGALKGSGIFGIGRDCRAAGGEGGGGVTSLAGVGAGDSSISSSTSVASREGDGVWLRIVSSTIGPDHC